MSSPLGLGRRLVRSLQVEVANACQNDCPFCLDRDESGAFPLAAQARLTTLAAMRRQLEAMAGQVERVVFTHGEPTLHPELPQAMEIARELGYGERVVVTNGRRLAEPGFLAGLVAAGLSRVMLSLHAAERSLYRQTAGRDGLGQVSEALPLLAAAVAAGDLRLGTSTVISRLNLDRLPGIVEFLLGLPADVVVLNVIRASGRARGSALVPRYEEVVAALSCLERLPGPACDRVVIEDLPACAAGPLLTRLGRLEDWLVAPQSDRLESPPTGSDPGRCRIEACAGCALQQSCPGLWPGYLEVHGAEGLRPLATRDLLPSPLVGLLESEVDLGEGWRLVDVRLEADTVVLGLASGSGRFEAELRADDHMRRVWRRDGRLALSYRADRPLGEAEEQVMAALARATLWPRPTRAVVWGPDGLPARGRA